MLILAHRAFQFFKDGCPGPDGNWNLLEHEAGYDMHCASPNLSFLDNGNWTNLATRNLKKTGMRVQLFNHSNDGTCPPELIAYEIDYDGCTAFPESYNIDRFSIVPV